MRDAVRGKYRRVEASRFSREGLVAIRTPTNGCTAVVKRLISAFEIAELAESIRVQRRLPSSLSVQRAVRFVNGGTASLTIAPSP